MIVDTEFEPGECPDIDEDADQDSINSRGIYDLSIVVSDHLGNVIHVLFHERNGDYTLPLTGATMQHAISILRGNDESALQGFASHLRPSLLEIIRASYLVCWGNPELALSFGWRAASRTTAPTASMCAPRSPRSPSRAARPGYSPSRCRRT